MAEDGIRYRGHKGNENAAPTTDFVISPDKNANPNTSSSSSQRRLNSNSSFTNNGSFTRSGGGAKRTSSTQFINDDDGGNDPDKISQPLLHNSFDPTTERPILAGDDETAKGGTSGAANNGSSSTTNNETGIFASIAAIARRVRCKMLDKIPVRFAARFAVPPPPPHRLKLLRKFISVHVVSVATANAEEQGLEPRSPLHHHMIATLWRRLNERAPRCVRRKIGEDDAGAELCPKKLTGSNWGLIGFQGKDCATDFRGAGALALEHMLHFVSRHPRLLERVAETPPEHAPITANYPHAVASINVTMLLIDWISSAGEATEDGKDASAAAKSTTGKFHNGEFSAMQARRKLAHYLTDNTIPFTPPSRAVATGGTSLSDKVHIWHSRQFKEFLESSNSAMDEIFGPTIGGFASPITTASTNSASAAAPAAAASSSTPVSTATSTPSQKSTQQQQQQREAFDAAANPAARQQEERELDMIAERLAAVHVAAVCMLHDEWLRGKRNVMYFKEVFSAFAARLELLLRDSQSFNELMTLIRED